MPAKKFVRYKLETEKEKALLDKIVATNNIQVPDDFTVPKPTPEPAPKKVTKRPRVRKK